MGEIARVPLAGFRIAYDDGGPDVVCSWHVDETDAEKRRRLVAEVRALAMYTLENWNDRTAAVDEIQDVLQSCRFVRFGALSVHVRRDDECNIEDAAVLMGDGEPFVTVHLRDAEVVATWGNDEASSALAPEVAGAMLAQLIEADGE